MWHKTLPILLLIFAVSAVQVEDDQQGYLDEENEAFVIEDASLERRGRQFRFEGPMSVTADLGAFGNTREFTCQSKDKGTGRCLTLKSCYPYFKIHNFAPADTWVMGLYDTCNFQTPTGRQVFGVCCNNTLPEELPEESSEEDSSEDNDAVVDENEDFTIEGQSSRSSCGFRAVYPPSPVTLYNQSPNTNAVPFFYHNIVQPYIVNGQEAIPHEYPFMAALLNLQRQFCGGSLIDKNHILTAAHCVAHMSKYDVQNLRVRLGDHNIRSNGASDGQTVEKKVRRVIRHKGFSSSTLWNDVAILTLEDDVQYTNNIQPICLARGSQNYVGNTVTVAGWGTLSEGGSQPSNLMKVNVKVWTNQRCKESYGSSAPGGITKHMLCASEYNRDSCSGDSGGPLFNCDRSFCEQIGIVSWGIGCAKQKYPGVYTRVTEMIPWIERIMREY